MERTPTRLYWYTGNREAGTDHARALLADGDPHLEHVGHTSMGLWHLASHDAASAIAALDRSRVAADAPPSPTRFPRAGPHWAPPRAPPQWVLYAALVQVADSDRSVCAYGSFLRSKYGAFLRDSPGRVGEESLRGKLPVQPLENVGRFLEDLQGEWRFEGLPLARSQ